MHDMGVKSHKKTCMNSCVGGMPNFKVWYEYGGRMRVTIVWQRVREILSIEWSSMQDSGFKKPYSEDLVGGCRFWQPIAWFHFHCDQPCLFFLMHCTVMCSRNMET